MKGTRKKRLILQSETVRRLWAEWRFSEGNRSLGGSSFGNESCTDCV